jgi:HEAT repeat protein
MGNSGSPGRSTTLDTQPMDTLIAALLSEDCLEQADAARFLGEIGRREAVPPLVKYVVECRNYAKVAGMEALARIRDASACPALRRLVKWPNVPDDWYWYCHRSVRAAAAVALLTLGDETGAAYLAELADKQDDVFFAWFAPAILRLPDRPRAAKELKGRITVQTLSQGGPGTTRFTNPCTAAMVTEALGLLPPAEARPRLRDMARSASRYVRGQAALGLLAQAAPDEDVLFVKEMAKKDLTDFVKVKASLALARAGKSGWIQSLAAACGKIRNPFDLAVALESLGAAGRREHAPVVQKRLGHSAPCVRQAAIEAMDRLGGDTKAVAKCVKDRNPRVRLSVARYLAVREGARA